MPEKLHPVKGNPERFAMDLVVELKGMVVTVKAGAAKIDGVTCDLVEDEVFTARTLPDRADLIGYLVRDHEDGDAIRILVDEVVSDGIDAPVDLNRDPRYDALAHVFHIAIPPNTTSLEGLELDRWLIVTPERWAEIRTAQGEG